MGIDPAFAFIKLAEALLEPGTLLLVATVAGALALAAGWRRAGWGLLGFGLGLEALIAIIPLDTLALAPLENRFPPCRQPLVDLAGIVALGGAVEPAIARARGTDALNGAAERMTTFVAEALRHPGLRLAFTGGSGSAFGPGALTEADIAGRLFASLGLAGRPIIFEHESRTTWENARDLAALVRPAPQAPRPARQAPRPARQAPRPARQAPWLLITSAAHMPRAVAAFRANGWSVAPDPVGYETASGRLDAAAFAIPYADRLVRLDGAFHEWLGLAVYRLLGRTKTLLPSPDPEICR